MIIEEGDHQDYTSDSMILTILNNQPHFVVATILMILIIAFFVWRFPI